jgi:predicted RecA/RadA family phage recombinase
LTAGDIAITDSGENFTAEDVEGALAELFQSVSNGKTLLAAAITDKGVTTAATDTFAVMAANIGDITTDGYDTSDATATADDIASGKTAYIATGKVTGNSTSGSQPAVTVSDNLSILSLAESTISLELVSA